MLSLASVVPIDASYVKMFQIASKSVDPSPWLVYPASNKTIWIVTILLGNHLLSQIVNFTMVSHDVVLSTVVANLTNTVPTDIVYDHNETRVWIVENDSLAYYDQTAPSRITIAKTFPNEAPEYLAIDSQDNLWLTLLTTDQIVEYDPHTGSSYNYSSPNSNVGLQGVAISPVDGTVWFAEAYAGKIGRIIPCNSSSCAVTEYSPPPGIVLQGLIQVAVDKTGVVWFTVHDGNEFGSFNPSTGEWKIFPIGYCPDSYVQNCELGLPNAIAIDPTGQVWFSEHYSGRIARYDPSNETLTEYKMPTTSATCNKDCAPYSWWMWPGENNLVWFVAFGLGEIGYVNSTIPVPFSVNALGSVTLNQGRRVDIPLSTDFVGGVPSLNVSATSQDTSSNPTVLSLLLTPEHVSSDGRMATSSLTISANWGSTLGPRYVAITAYNENVTANSFLKVDVVASLSYATLGLAGGTSAFAIVTLTVTRYTKKNRNNGATSNSSRLRSD